jgi:16S rRNA processing protein RimM
MGPGSRLRASGAHGSGPRSLESREPEVRSLKPQWDELVLVGRIARPHGLRGQVVVNPETDFIDERFRVGATLQTRGPSGEETLTVSTFRIHGGRPIVGFEGFDGIDAVERLAGQELRVPEEALQALEPGSFYHHQLVGCAVETLAGERVGEVERVEGGIGGSRLVVGGRRGEVLVPLASTICVEIDPDARRIRIDPPEGLLDLNEVRYRHDLPADGRSRPGRGDRQPGD